MLSDVGSRPWPSLVEERLAADVETTLRAVEVVDLTTEENVVRVATVDFSFTSSSSTFATADFLVARVVCAVELDSVVVEAALDVEIELNTDVDCVLVVVADDVEVVPAVECVVELVCGSLGVLTVVKDLAVAKIDCWSPWVADEV